MIRRGFTVEEAHGVLVVHVRDEGAFPVVPGICVRGVRFEYSDLGGGFIRFGHNR